VTPTDYILTPNHIQSSYSALQVGTGATLLPREVRTVKEKITDPKLTLGTIWSKKRGKTLD
jgi:hypothetical protein